MSGSRISRHGVLGSIAERKKKKRGFLCFREECWDCKVLEQGSLQGPLELLKCPWLWMVLHFEFPTDSFNGKIRSCLTVVIRVF